MICRQATPSLRTWLRCVTYLLTRREYVNPSREHVLALALPICIDAVLDTDEDVRHMALEVMAGIVDLDQQVRALSPTATSCCMVCSNALNCQFTWCMRALKALCFDCMNKYSLSLPL